MSYYRKKYRVINGKTYGPYWYKVRTVRRGRRVRQIIVDYLGKDGPVQRETVKEQFQEPDSNITKALHVYSSVKEWIVFDFETTGFGQDDKIIEAAFQRFSMENGKLIEGEKYHTLVDPQRYIPKPVVELTGIHPWNVKGKPIIEEILPDIKEFIKGSHLVAHNAKFDKRFLDREFEKVGYSKVKDERIIDTLDMSRKMYGSSERHNLNVCVDRERVGVDEEVFHAADFDVLMTAKVFVSMCKKLLRYRKKVN